jgi:hypothetical protein
VSAAKARRELSVGALDPATIKKRMAARTSRAALIKSGLVQPSRLSAREFNVEIFSAPTLPDPLMTFSEIGTFFQEVEMSGFPPCKNALPEGNP